MRVLFVKLTSMGDLIHALPALSDAQRAIPNIQFDWVIDESFAEVASWHSAVVNIIPSAHRRWRKNLWQTLVDGDFRRFIRALRRNKYDLVIDGQTNLKAALVTLCSRGIKCGFDKTSAREYPAHLAYNRRYHHPKQDHAITRVRSLVAQALGYATPTDTANFAIQLDRLVKPAIDLPKKYLFFVHNASWVTKLWPEEYWQQLISYTIQAGYSILLPSGNNEEMLRAQRLAQAQTNVIALPRLKLSEVAYLLAHAEAAVCVDTGLSHLSAALNVPAITIYGATDSGLIGATSALSKQIHLQSKFACAPCNQMQCSYTSPSQVKPACNQELNPELVWSQLQSLLATAPIS